MASRDRKKRALESRTFNLGFLNQQPLTVGSSDFPSSLDAVNPSHSPVLGLACPTVFGNQSSDSEPAGRRRRGQRLEPRSRSFRRLLSSPTKYVVCFSRLASSHCGRLVETKLLGHAPPSLQILVVWVVDDAPVFLRC